LKYFPVLLCERRGCAQFLENGNDQLVGFFILPVLVLLDDFHRYLEGIFGHLFLFVVGHQLKF
jgi:hypothetical protein